jgi:hypothetical protein
MLSRNYHHYSNLNGIIKHKAGKKIVAITDDTITKDVRFGWNQMDLSIRFDREVHIHF